VQEEQSRPCSGVARRVGGLVWRLQADKRHLMRLAGAGVHEDRGRVFGQVRDPGIVDRELVLAYCPGRALARLVDSACDWLDVLRSDSVVIPTDDAVRVHGKLEHIVWLGFILLRDSEYADRQPFSVRVDLGCLTLRGELRGLVLVLLGRGGGVAVDVDGVGLDRDVAAVVVRSRC
jgi:hypothetical protein